MSNIPQPTSMQSVQSWRRDVQRAIENTGARTLESASINNGTLRVMHGGGITIADGGSLRLLAGANLVLGKGKILGDALNERFEPVAFEEPTQEQSFTPGNAWKTIRKTTLKAPAWASECIIQATASAWVEMSGDYAYVERGELKTLVESLQTAHVTMGTYQYYTNKMNAGASNMVTFAATPRIPDNKTITITLQARIITGGGSVKTLHTAMSGLVIWSRKTN